MRTEFLTLTVLAGTGMFLTPSPAAIAALNTSGWTYPDNDPSPSQTYDFTFASGGMDATGTITVQNGVAFSGSVNVTGVPLEASPSSAISGVGMLLVTLGRQLRRKQA
ncbi:MAG: hypothetical protein ACLQVY_06430 [Limisphaerales bacterium]